MASNQLLALASWYFLPRLVTGYVQTTLYSIFIRAGDPKPTPGSARYTRDRRAIHIAVIVAYLLYTLYEADYQIQSAPDFYRLLNVPHDASEKAIQSRFRRLTIQFHPDKAAPGSDKAMIENLYVQLTLAKDTLVHPAKRFAYDRCGPDVLQWSPQHHKVTKDFVLTGLQHILGYYGVSSGVLVLLSTVGYLRQGMFWRYLVVASLFVIEMQTMTRPHFPILLTKIVNPFMLMTGIRPAYLPFQMITLLRKFAVTVFIAMSQLGPLLQDPKQTALEEGDASGGVPGPLLDRVDELTNATNSELSRLMQMELIPFASEPSAGRQLRETLKNWLVQNNLRNDPEVNMAIQQVLERRRAEGRGHSADVRVEGRR